MSYLWGMKCDTRWNGNPMGSYHGDETIPYHVESYHTRPYHGGGIIESYHTMGMESLQDCLLGQVS